MIWRIAIAFLVPSGRVVTSSCLTYCKCTRSDDTVSSCPDVSRIKSPTHKTLSVFTNDDHVDLLAVLTRHLSDSIDRPISLSPEKGRPTISDRVLGRATHRSNRSDVGVQVQVLSQSNDRARVSFHLVGGRRDSAEHRSVTFLSHDAMSPIRRRYPLCWWIEMKTSLRNSKWDVRSR